MIDLNFFFSFVDAFSAGKFKLSEIIHSYLKFTDRNMKSNDDKLDTLLNAHLSLDNYLKTTKKVKIRECASKPDIKTLLSIFQLPIRQQNEEE